MKLVSCNIQHGHSEDEKYNLSRCIDELQGASIIMLQEVEHLWVLGYYDGQTSPFEAATKGHDDANKA